MSKKHWIILVVLLLTALVPVLRQGRTRSKPVSTESDITGKEQSTHQVEDTKENSEQFAKADLALQKFSELSKQEPIDDQSADELLKESQLQTEERKLEPIFEPTLAPTAEPTVIPTAKPTSIKYSAIPERAFSSDAEQKFFSEEAQPQKPVISEEEKIELEKLRIQIVSLESKLEEQKKTADAQMRDLKSKLDVQESENLKLSHQLQAAENATEEAKKGGQKVKELDTKIEKLQLEISQKQKLVDLTKNFNVDFSKKLSEEQKIRKSVEDQLAETIKKRDDQSRENEKLKRAVGDFEKRVKLIEEQRLAESKDKEQVLMKQVTNLRKDLSSAQGALEDLKKKSKSASTDIAAATAKTEELQKLLDAKQSENDELNVRLATAQRIDEKSKELQQQLLTTRNELMLAQEQVRTLMTTSKNPNPDYQTRTFPRTETVQPPRIERNPPTNRQPVVTPPPSSDYLTVEVTAQKAALRAGPGEENSTVMEIQQGSKLIVEAREGDWYRVIAPKGQRAYLRTDLAVELDSTGRPRFSTPQTKVVSPRPTRAPNNALNTPPDSDPLVELLGRQLRERNMKNPQEKEDSLSADGPEAGPTPSPTSEGSGEDEMEAFDNLKKGMKKD